MIICLGRLLLLAEVGRVVNAQRIDGTWQFRFKVPGSGNFPSLKRTTKIAPLIEEVLYVLRQIQESLTMALLAMVESHI